MDCRILCFIFLLLIIILIILSIKINWCGTHNPKYRLIDSFKNQIIKYSHRLKIRDLNTDVCYENLSIIHKAFSKSGIPFWLSEGTALGFFRENRILPWDDDVDIAFREKYVNKFIKEIIPFLEEKGFVVSEIYENKNLRFFALVRKNEKVDIDIIREDPNKGCMAANYGKKGCGQLFPYLKDFKKINIRGKIYNLPKIGYIKKLYGDTWNTKIVDFKNRKNFK